MKRRKIFSIAVFLLSLLLFGTYKVYGWIAHDKYAPIIEIDEEELKVSISADKEELLKGVTANDSKDGDVTDSIVIESISKFLNDDKKLVTYAAFDSDNHVGKATREVSYTDYTSPKFSCKEPFRFPVNTTNLISAVTAMDCIDGDITEKIKISPGYSVVTDTPGDYEVQIQVANSSGDVEYLPLTIEIYDPTDRTITPDIQLKKYIVYTKIGKEVNASKYLDKVMIGSGEYELSNESSTYNSQSPSAGGTMSYDYIDIDTSKVDYSKAGTYVITYKMTIDEESVGKTRLFVVVRDEAEEK